MQFVSHPLIKKDAIEEREYQLNILNTAVKNNTLCVLPTGLGKTPIAILLAVDRLTKFPEKKILMMSPTRPLCAQHEKSFKNILTIDEELISLVTGIIRPDDRRVIYKNSRIIIATPQTIENDLKNYVIDLNDFSLLVFDECHRAVKDYAYTYVADRYKEIPNHLILGLTASPGSSEEKIKQICKNLGIKSVEIRTEIDEDVSEFVKDIKLEYVKLNLPDDMRYAQENLKIALRFRLERLKEYSIHVNRKSELLQAQKKISNRIHTEKKPILYYLASLTAETIKIWHALELLETQSIKSLKIYFDKLRDNKIKSNVRVLNDKNVKNAIMYFEKPGLEHPKIEKLREIIKKEIGENKNVSIIIFSHYRDNIDKIHENLEPVCRPVILIGQRGEKGLTQKEQIDVIKDFNAGYYNCLITSPIGEEGLHIPSADIAIFYDSVPSEIRTIQRRGRVGRTKVGKIIFLLTKKTRDESNFYASMYKERRMKTILRQLQSQKKLTGF
jgi:Fanconi anemia group M protein